MRDDDDRDPQADDDDASVLPDLETTDEDEAQMSGDAPRVQGGMIGIDVDGDGRPG